jgi:hypothetical protein
MGTTVTTNLSLIKPDSNEKIMEDLPTFNGWADQNADNCDAIDALFRNSTASSVPVWTASVNPVLGAGGLLETKIVRLYPRMVLGFFRIYTGGAGFTAGTGGYNLSVPVAIAPELATFVNELPVGKACFYDDSAAATSSAFTVMYSTVGGTFFFKQPNNDAWTAASPVALAQQDRVSGYFMYPTSVP